MYRKSIETLHYERWLIKQTIFTLMGSSMNQKETVGTRDDTKRKEQGRMFCVPCVVGASSDESRYIQCCFCWTSRCFWDLVDPAANEHPNSRQLPLDALQMHNPSTDDKSPNWYDRTRVILRSHAQSRASKGGHHPPVAEDICPDGS
jgi:hypothetical protein